MHGPFKDITIHSPDSEIAEISKKRILTAIETAKKLNSEILILHTGINTQIKNKNYLKNSLKIQAEFYQAVIEQNADLRIYIENMWESNPDPFIELYDLVNHERFGICFDTGHANIFGNIPIEKWIRILGDKIKYFHLNDNNGDYDSESALGDGNINWESVFNEIKFESEQELIAVFEVGSIENIEKSIIVAEKIMDAT
jgi:sugar phosphate isomerase/epimerase